MKLFFIVNPRGIWLSEDGSLLPKEALVCIGKEIASKKLSALEEWTKVTAGGAKIKDRCICALPHSLEVYPIRVTFPLDGLHEQLKLIIDHDQLTHAAYHAVTCFEILTQLTQVAEVFPDGPERRLTHRLLGVIHGIMSRGPETKEWLS
jgi:hypothetical protein